MSQAKHSGTTVVRWCIPGRNAFDLANPGDVVREINAARITSKEALLQAVASVLEFPDYFANNWDSFEECLAELEFVPQNHRLILVFRQAGNLFKLNDVKTLFSIFVAVGREWNKSDEGRGLLVVLEGEADANANAVLISAGVNVY